MSLLRLLLLGLLVAVSFVARVEAQDVLPWETDLAQAQQVAGQTNRLVLVHFWGTWCQPCVRMDREVLSKPGLGKVLAPHFVAVKIQVEQGLNEALAKQYGVDAFPCDIVMTPQGQILHRSRGFHTAEQYVAMLQQAVQARAVAPGANVQAATTPAATSLTDDRYSYYFQGRGTPPGSTVPAAPAVATVPPPVSAPPVSAPPVAAPPVAAPPVAAPPVAVSPVAMPPVSVPPAVAAVPAPARPDTPPADDRYADYRAAATPAHAMNVPFPAAPAVSPPPTSAPPTAPTVTTTVPTTAPKIAAAPAAPPKSATSAVQLPPGCPPLALDGYCPVTVTDKMVWKKGDVRFGALHRGRTYLFASAEEQKTFLADPDRYSPVISGNDPVVALEKGETVPGKREFGLMCQNRMFLFSSKESYDKFCGDSKRYSGEIFQALEADDLKRR